MTQLDLTFERKPRFTNSLVGVLNLNRLAEAELQTFVFALQDYVAALRQNNGVISMKNNAAMPRLRVWVPLLRDLEKLLHQANAVKNFRPVLGRLAFALLDIAFSPNYGRDGREVKDLPVTGNLLKELASELNAGQKLQLRYRAVPLDVVTHLEGTLTAGNFGEVADHLRAEVASRQASKKERLIQVLRKAKAALEPEEWALLRPSLRVSFSDEDLDAPQ